MGCAMEHSSQLRAHDTLATVLEQTVACAPHADAIDFEFVWAFHGDVARAERRAMDTDLDGRISDDEARSYAEALLRRSDTALRLTAAGRNLDLVSYYDPDVLLGSERRVTGAPLTLKLFCFARWPGKLSGEVRLEIEDVLWIHLPTLLQTSIGVPSATTGNEPLAVDLIDQALRSVPAGTPRVSRFSASAPTASLARSSKPGLDVAACLAPPRPGTETADEPSDDPADSWLPALWAPAFLLGLLFLMSQICSR